jgi:ABC-type phosphate transport system substrate-binding protein
MKDHKRLLACLALVAAGLVAGCGGGDDTATAPTATAAGDTSTTSTATEASGSATPDDVYQACLDAVEGTAAESAGQKACANARDAFEQCTTQASNAPEGEARDAALKACQEAADKATAALNAAP